MPDSQSEAQDFELTVTAEDRERFKRLDLFLVEKLSDYSRSTIKRLFEDDAISAENVTLSLNKMPPTGTVIEVEVPPPLPTDLIAENIPLEILHEDPHLIIINKPAGMVVHPAPGHSRGTLVNAILYHCPDLKGIGAEKRPGIVHRLDMGTSGVMVVAKDHSTHEGLVQLFSTHDIERRYEALVLGRTEHLSGTLESTIGRHPTNRLKMAAHVKVGKKAITHYKVIRSYEQLSHMELKLETGRTHQIRVHMAQLLHSPVLCDPLYGSTGPNLKKLPEQIRLILEPYPFQLLHARDLGFVHPVTGQKLFFTASPPAIFKSVLEALSLQK
jgi:23S rRNA pseudouridine1911/1915/1917 synthase